MNIDYSQLVENFITYLFSVTLIVCHFYKGPNVKTALKNFLKDTSDTIVYISRTKEFRISYLIFIGIQFIVGTIAALFIGILAWADAFSILNTILWFSLLFLANSLYCYQSYKLAKM